MSSFLYFAESLATPVKHDHVLQWGLAYAFDSTPASMQLIGATPTGKPGWLFGDTARHGEATFGFDAGAQAWEKIPQSDLWIGYDRVRRPTPQRLARREQIAGTELRLADGNLWLIPQLRYFDSLRGGLHVSLPVIARVGEDGDWVSGGVDPRYADIDAVGDRLLEAALSVLGPDNGKPLADNEALDLYALLLQANYHISRVEVGLLGLFSVQKQLAEIGRVAIDLATAEEWAQKKTRDNAPTDGGG